MRYRALPLFTALVASVALAAPGSAQARERARPAPAPRAQILAGPATARATAATASYVTYGAGCQGTGLTGVGCESLNPAGGTLQTQTLANEYAFGVPVTQATTILGFRLFTQTNGATSTAPSVPMTCALYLQSATTTSMQPAASSTTCGTMLVGPTPQFYSVYFNPPVTVPAGTNVWISQYDSQNVLVSSLTAGNPPALPTYWRRPAGGGGAWGVTGIVQFPSWELICDGGTPTAAPLLTNKDQPVLGSTYHILLAHAAPGGVPAFLFFGASRTTWAGIPLPFDMSFLGATGCSIRASGEIVVPSVTSAFGTAAITINVPNLPSLDGTTLFNQWIIFDPTANSFGLVFSNGGAGTFGN